MVVLSSFSSSSFLFFCNFIVLYLIKILIFLILLHYKILMPKTPQIKCMAYWIIIRRTPPRPWNRTSRGPRSPLMRPHSATTPPFLQVTMIFIYSSVLCISYRLEDESRDRVNRLWFHPLDKSVGGIFEDYKDTQYLVVLLCVWF